MDLRISLITVWIVAATVAMTAQANMREYMADLATPSWSYQDQKELGCVLRHSIPGYGEARFTRTAQGMIFQLRSLEPAVEENDILYHASPPAWRQDMLYTEMGEGDLAAGQSQMELKGERADALLRELEMGRHIDFVYRETVSGVRHARVTLTVAHFLPALEQFKQCRSPKIIAGKPKPVVKKKARKKIAKGNVRRRGIIRFATGSAELGKYAERTLSDLVYYLKVHPEVKSVVINGHTDTVGTNGKNMRLSLERARMVQRYFVANGIPASKLRTRFHGESSPVANNKDTDGRTLNRRVRIDLVR
ncbi:MAG: hypothetical protein BMS9Abin36_1396 [Gammaproteobacteria bacterium]|nr:MAG: hypothetical protein BMS9Abin36_1396 [Gammaproteobacteria bacterium]